MALQLDINKDYASQRMTTETGIAELGNMTQLELLSIAIQAVKSRNPLLQRCFIKLPVLADLQAAKVALEQPDLAPVVVTPTTVSAAPAKPVKSKQQVEAEIKAATETIADDSDLLSSLPS
jgi:hypothetical protein